VKKSINVGKTSKVIAGASLLGCIGFYVLSSPNAYEIYVNGKAVACIKDMNTAEVITNEIYSELVNRFDGLKIEENTIYKRVIASDSAQSSKEDIKANIIKALSTKVKAVEMVVDGNMVGILANVEEGERVKSKLKEHYSNKASEKHEKFKEISSVVKYNSVEAYISEVDYVDKIVEKLIANTDQGVTPGVKLVYEKEESVSSNSSNVVSMMAPSRGTISSLYGERWGRMHEGIDIAAKAGSPIYAAMDGKVIYAGWIKGYGKVVKIQHNGNIQTLYGHCSVLRVSEGKFVKKGQHIADVGSTGNSTGPHVHFEVIINGTPVNPYPYIYK